MSLRANHWQSTRRLRMKPRTNKNIRAVRPTMISTAYAGIRSARWPGRYDGGAMLAIRRKRSIRVCMRSSSVSRGAVQHRDVAAGGRRERHAPAACCSSCSSSAIRRPSWSSASLRLAPLSSGRPAAALCSCRSAALLILRKRLRVKRHHAPAGRGQTAPQASFSTSSESVSKTWRCCASPGVRRARAEAMSIALPEASASANG